MTKKTDLDVAEMKKDIEYIKEKLDNLIVNLNCLDKKYASKLTENIVYGLCAFVLIAFLTKLIKIW